MSRSVGQVAKLLGVNSAQVKRWAYDFGKFLSSGAVPPKERRRMFNDSDVLVLIYVCAKWEEQPNLESIRSGLSDGDHHEEEFLKHLYLNTPILQEPPEDLDETWRHGFLLCGAGMQEYLELARNYRNVAEDLLDTALRSGDPLDFAFPVLFSYRHTLELYLKIIGEISEFTHSLARCVQLVEKRLGRKINPRIRGWIIEMDTIDPRGTAFRYVGEGGPVMHYEEHWLDLEQFKFAMAHIFQILDLAVLNLSRPKGS